MYEFPNGPPDSEAEWFEALMELARHLRGPEGCPWDRRQTAASFAGYAREEADEFCEALASGDAGHSAEEFGDVFFVLLAAVVAAEDEGRFTLREALECAHEKMVRRHAHVFGDAKAKTPEDAIDSWNRIKEREQER